MASGVRGALLLLADGRLPTGGHAHSGGLEEAVAAGRVRHAPSLAAWLTGRLATAGRVETALAAATAAAPDRATLLDAEAAARCPSPALRKASRAQGRGLVRAGRRMWPCDLLDELFGWRPDGLMWPVALGSVGAAIGADPEEVAAVAAHAVISGPAWAATRLLGLDPFAVAAVLADLAPALDEVAAQGACAARAAVGADHTAQTDVDFRTLAAHGAPLSEIGAQLHATWETRLFAS